MAQVSRAMHRAGPSSASGSVLSAGTRGQCAPCRRVARATTATKSSNEKQQQTAASDSAQEAPVYREFRSLGMKVVETNTALPGPETEVDFWDQERFDKFGKVLENYFIPGVVVVAVLIGAFAVKTYNNDADIFIKPAGAPDAQPQIVFAAPVETSAE